MAILTVTVPDSLVERIDVEQVAQLLIAAANHFDATNTVDYSAEDEKAATDTLVALEEAAWAVIEPPYPETED